MRKAAFGLILLTLAIFLCAARPAMAAAPRYTCQDLGAFIQANAINAAGQVVGYMPTSSGTRAFLFSGGVMHDLGTLAAPYNFASWAHAINARGEVVGVCDDSSGLVRHAFLYRDGSMHDLGALPGGESSYAADINDSGQVVGWAEKASYVKRAFLYSGSVMQDLGTLAGSDYPDSESEAVAINAAGQVTGVSDILSTPSTGDTHPFLYSGGVMQDMGTLPAPYNSWNTPLDLDAAGEVAGYWQDPAPPYNWRGFFYNSQGKMLDLGILGGNGTWIFAISAAGQVVGDSGVPSGLAHAFLYGGGVLKDLGTLPAPYNGASCASSINNLGQAVGSSNPDPNSSAIYGHAFLYSGGVMQDLNKLVQNLPPEAYPLNDAFLINDRSQIVANGADYHTYLLTPISSGTALNMLLLLD